MRHCDLPGGGAAAQRIEQMHIIVIVSVSQLQRAHESIAQRTDAKLQCAAIADERTCVHANCVLLDAYGCSRRGEGCKVMLAIVNDQVEELACDFCIPGHEWQLFIDLRDH